MVTLSLLTVITSVYLMLSLTTQPVVSLMETLTKAFNRLFSTHSSLEFSAFSENFLSSMNHF